MAEGKQLSRDDLYLLMSSYENWIKSYSVLSEQQKRNIEKSDEIYDLIEDIKTKIADLKDNGNKSEDELCDKISELDKRLNEKIGSSNVEAIKNYNSLKIMLWGAFFGMVGIIGSLIKLYFDFKSNFDILKELIKSLGLP